MQMKKKMMVLAVALGASTFHWGGCGGGDGGRGWWYNVTRFLGDVVATNIVLTNVD
jgi:hypothetical protein